MDDNTVSKVTNAANLKLIKVSKSCHGKFTANYPKPQNFDSKKNAIEFYTLLFLKI